MRIPRKRKKYLKTLSKSLIKLRKDGFLTLPLVQNQNGDYFILGYNLKESTYILNEIGFITK